MAPNVSNAATLAGAPSRTESPLVEQKNSILRRIAFTYSDERPRRSPSCPPVRLCADKHLPSGSIRVLWTAEYCDAAPQEQEPIESMSRGRTPGLQSPRPLVRNVLQLMRACLISQA